MRIRVIDAFTDRPFAGNPAAVCVLDGPGWPDEAWMQQVASEMNLSETAFVRPETGTDAEWEKYLSRLRDSGQFTGGSAIGDGICVNKKGSSPPIAAQLTGYIRVQAKSLDDAQRLLEGNPVYEAGGTIEIRVLPRN